MNDKIMDLHDVFIELSEASKLAVSDEDVIKLMHKYDIVFAGEKHNEIDSLELVHTLNYYFHIRIDNEELTELIPIVCDAMKLKYQGMRRLDDKQAKVPYCYKITLF